MTTDPIPSSRRLSEGKASLLVVLRMIPIRSHRSLFLRIFSVRPATRSNRSWSFVTRPSPVSLPRLNQIVLAKKFSPDLLRQMFAKDGLSQEKYRLIFHMEYKANFYEVVGALTLYSLVVLKCVHNYVRTGEPFKNATLLSVHRKGVMIPAFVITVAIHVSLFQIGLKRLIYRLYVKMPSATSCVPSPTSVANTKPRFTEYIAIYKNPFLLDRRWNFTIADMQWSKPPDGIKRFFKPTIRIHGRPVIIDPRGFPDPLDYNVMAAGASRATIPEEILNERQVAAKLRESVRQNRVPR